MSSAPPDLEHARRTFETSCSQCHELAEVDKHPPKSRAAANALIRRMVEKNDAVLTPEEIVLITAWLDAHYVAKPH